MKEYIRRFWTWLVSLAGVVALYVGAVAAKLTKYFWVVVILAGVLAGITPTWKLLRDILKRIRTYPALLQRVANAEAKLEQLQADRKSLPRKIREAKELGRAEAWAMIEGAIRARQMEPPKLVGITEESGSLFLVAEYDAGTQPQLNAWFMIQGITGNTKGMAKITRIDDAKNIVLLAPVGDTEAPFWTHLASRVAYDDSPPQSVILAGFVPEAEQMSPGWIEAESLREGSND